MHESPASRSVVYKKSIMSSLMDNRGCHRTHPSHDYHTAVPVR